MERKYNVQVQVYTREIVSKLLVLSYGCENSFRLADAH